MDITLSLSQAVAQVLKSLYGIEAEAESVVLQDTRKEFKGDYTLVVFPYVKQARKSPEAVANEIGAAVKELLPEVAGYNVIKGFLNFEIADSYWSRFVGENAKDSRFGLAKTNPAEAPVVVEYSSPNTNKPLHLGHIRNNLLGWSVSCLLEAAGANVKKVNLVNDRGIHICKSMLAWKLYGNGETPESSGMKGDHLVGKYYVEFDKHYKEEVKKLMESGVEEEQAKKDAPLMVEAQSMLKRWEEGDKEVRDLWEKMNGWVYAGFDETYRRLGVGFDKVYYESNTYLLGKELVQKGLDMGVLFRKEDGSVWCDLTGDGLDQKLLLRKDGTSVYITQDIGTTILKHEEHNPDTMIWVVGDEQNLHFRMLFTILGRLGYAWADSLYHLSYGMVNLPSGRMKSREGTVVDADDLFDEMHSLAKAAAMERVKEGEEPPADLESRSEIIGMGALKFMLLKFNPKTTIMFDPQASLKFEGDTGPYVQYVCARINSIVRKCNDAGIAFDPASVDWSLADSPEEKALAVASLRYADAIRSSADKMDCSILVNYLLDLAKLFNRFYREKQVLNAGDPVVRTMRLALCFAVRDILADGLAALTIGIPDAM